MYQFCRQFKFRKLCFPRFTLYLCIEIIYSWNEKRKYIGVVFGNHKINYDSAEVQFQFYRKKGQIKQNNSYLFGRVTLWLFIYSTS